MMEFTLVFHAQNCVWFFILTISSSCSTRSCVTMQIQVTTQKQISTEKNHRIALENATKWRKCLKSAGKIAMILMCIPVVRRVF